MFGGNSSAGNGAGFGTRLSPRQVRPDGILPLTFAGDVTSVLTDGIAGFNRLFLGVRVTPVGASSQAQMRVLWIMQPSPAFEYAALRRDETDAVIDDLNLPSVTSTTELAIPLANPGGAFGVRILFREVGLPANPGNLLANLTGVS